MSYSRPLPPEDIYTSTFRESSKYSSIFFSPKIPCTIEAMASSSRALSKLAAHQLGAAQLGRLRAPIMTSRFLQTSTRPARPSCNGRTTPVDQQFKRLYADDAAPKKPRRFRTLRWIWRLTYLSFFGSVAYIGYGIYLDRHPEPQVEADPTKKTLVVLGKFKLYKHP